jgi:hypothetical protein
MSVDLDLSRVRVRPPTTKPYRYLAVEEKVPRFKNFNGLNADTKRRIEKIGMQPSNRNGYAAAPRVTASSQERLHIFTWEDG